MSCRGPTEASYGYLPVTASSSVRPRLLKERWQSTVHISLKTPSNQAVGHIAQQHEE